MPIKNSTECLLQKCCRSLELASLFPDRYKILFDGAGMLSGKLPAGCSACFSRAVLNIDGRIPYLLNINNVCNCECEHCMYIGHPKQKQSFLMLDSFWKEQVENYLICNENSFYHPQRFCFELQNRGKELLFVLFNFTGYNSEPLLYLPLIEYLCSHITSNLLPISKLLLPLPAVLKLYTNGVLLTEQTSKALSQMGINEIRVNVAADLFSDQVYANIATAKKYIEKVGIEVAVYPKYEQKLFEMMDIASHLKVDFVNLCQLKYFDRKQVSLIEQQIPDAVFYRIQNYFVLEDGGLTERLISYAFNNEYDLNILDCNVFCLLEQDNPETDSRISVEQLKQILL